MFGAIKNKILSFFKSEEKTAPQPLPKLPPAKWMKTIQMHGITFFIEDNEDF